MKVSVDKTIGPNAINQGHNRFDVLGVELNAVDLATSIQTTQRWIELDEPQYICFCNVHTIISCQNDPTYKKVIHGAGLVVPDGMPLVWIGRQRGFHQIERVYGPDFLLKMCQISQDFGYRHFFYGGAPGIAEVLSKKLQHRFPRLQVVGTHSPPYRSFTREEDENVARLINYVSPNIIWVGLGSPKQDYWAFNHVGRLNHAVILPVGAAFDFLSGRIPQAPQWMRKSGLEWLFRLASEPKRLWKRYLIENPLFVLMLIGQALGLQRSTKE